MYHGNQNFKYNLNVNIFEADIDTLAIQGPKSFKLMEEVFGKEITKLKFFNYDFYNFRKNKYIRYKNYQAAGSKLRLEPYYINKKL